MEMAMAMTMAMAAGVVTMFGDGQTLELFALTMYDIVSNQTRNLP